MSVGMSVKIGDKMQVFKEISENQPTINLTKH